MVNWNCLNGIQDSNEMYDKIEQIITNIYNNNKTLRKCQCSNNRMRNEWMTKELLELIKKKNNLWVKITKFETPPLELVEEYREMKKIVRKEVQENKQKFYNNYFTTNSKDSHKIWTKINSLIGNKNKKDNIDSLLMDTFKREKTKTTCQKFVNNFMEQVPKLRRNYKRDKRRQNLKLRQNVISSINSMSILHASPNDIQEILNKIKTKKATGYDGFQMDHFIKTKENTCKFMAKLINVIIETEVWPDKLKKQVLRPIYKKGDKNNLNNYRPIALLPVLNKIVEKFFSTRVENFLNDFGMLNKFQFGYQRGIGTIDALHNINDNVVRALNEGKHVGAIMIDLQKAFDTLEKNTILEKLNKHGIRGKILNILNSYLTNRKCSVKINDEFSEWKNVNYGVPQGSILGPLMFLIYINDIQEIAWNTYITLYADDIFLLSIHNDEKTMIRNLQTDFNKICQYLTENDLYMSIEKTCFMNIKTSHMKLVNEDNMKIIAHDTDCTNHNGCICKTISKVKQAKYLGIELDNTWKFYNHIDNLTTRMRKVIPTFYRLKNLLNVKNKRQIFEALIMSICRYGCTIYGTTSNGLIKRIQQILNKAIKVLFNQDRQIKKTNTILKEQKILTFKQMMDYATLIHNYNKSTFKIPISRQIRHNNNWLLEPFCRNSYGKRNQAFVIPHTFNKLPTHLRKFTNIYKAKKEIKKWLIT